MTQNIVIIGDTHFGARNNSMIWLKHQTEGFKEIIRYVEESVQIYDETIVIHVGDLFDSRSSINPMVYKSVEKVMDAMNQVMEKSSNNAHMYIVGGNHDYYYQWESENNYSSTLMLPKFNRITYVNTQVEEYAGIIMIPWFIFHNPDMLRSIIKGKNPAKNMIFTHTDPFHLNPEIARIIKGYPLITGHIHQPVIDRKNFILVTGATYPIDFADTNSERGFWVISREYSGSNPTDFRSDFHSNSGSNPTDFRSDFHSNSGSNPTDFRLDFRPDSADFRSDFHSNSGSNPTDFRLDFHPVKSSIHFFTITEHMLRDWKTLGIKKDDYVEVQIRANHVDDYKDILKELNDNFNTNMMYITESNDLMMEHAEILNVDSVCRKLLPEKLKPIYNKMIKECSN